MTCTKGAVKKKKKNGGPPKNPNAIHTSIQPPPPYLRSGSALPEAHTSIHTHTERRGQPIYKVYVYICIPAVRVGAARVLLVQGRELEVPGRLEAAGEDFVDEGLGEHHLFVCVFFGGGVKIMGRSHHAATKKIDQIYPSITCGCCFWMLVGQHDTIIW